MIAGLRSMPVARAPRAASSATARPVPQPTSTTLSPLVRRSSSYAWSRSRAASGRVSKRSRADRNPGAIVMMVSMRVQVDLKSSVAIGDLAARLGLPTHVLRHWEEMGLLRPARTSAGRRRYTEADAERTGAILLAKDAGLGLADIRELLSAPGPARRA